MIMMIVAILVISAMFLMAAAVFVFIAFCALLGELLAAQLLILLMRYLNEKHAQTRALRRVVFAPEESLVQNRFFCISNEERQDNISCIEEIRRNVPIRTAEVERSEARQKLRDATREKFNCPPRVRRRAPVRNKCAAAQAIPSRRSPRLAALSAAAEPIAAVVVETRRRRLPHVRSRALVC